MYLVQHVHTDQQLALKLLHAAVVTDEVALARFRREARAPARVNSDHVVQVTDADVAPELGGVPFLVMELLRGQDLEELVAERGAAPRRTRWCSTCARPRARSTRRTRSASSTAISSPRTSS